MGSDDIRITLAEENEGILEIHLCRPQSLNALPRQMLERLRQAFAVDAEPPSSPVRAGTCMPRDSKPGTVG
jgi:enoyl-CoA hydratase/carnithine racemase